MRRQPPYPNRDCILNAVESSDTRDEDAESSFPLRATTGNGPRQRHAVFRRADLCLEYCAESSTRAASEAQTAQEIRRARRETLGAVDGGFGELLVGFATNG